MDGLDIGVSDGIADALRRRPSERRTPRRHRLIRYIASPFGICVVLPTLISAFYFLFIASPQYVSEAQFVVRGISASQPSMLSSLIQTAGGGSSASEDTYAVEDYMTSRDAAENLIRQNGLIEVFDVPGADFLARYPNIIFHKGFEHFYRYYQRHVEAELDSTTGISTLTVRTFSPENSQRIARALIVAAEDLVNRMNQRQRDNLLASAQHEVTDAQTQLRAIGSQIAAYRNREALLDPTKQSTPLLKDLDDLKVMRTTTEMQIEQLRASAPDSPLLQVYHRRMAALDDQIRRGEQRVTGSASSLVPKITAYDDLATQRDLLEKQLQAAAVRLEAAKTQADHQALFLDEIVRPNAPDYAAYPHGIADTLIVFASCLGLYFMGRLLIAGVREHQIV